MDVSGWASSTAPFTMDLLDVTADPDGDAVSIVSVTPTAGQVEIVGTVFTFTPSRSESGTVVFDVTITDGKGGFGSYTITIEVVPVRTISGVAFIDTDEDGSKDPGEAPVAGAIVIVTHPGGDGVMDTADDIVRDTTTGADGTWAIDEIPLGMVRVQTFATGRVMITQTTDSNFVETPYAVQLPATGVNLSVAGSVAMMLVALGGALLFSIRRREEDTETA